VVEDLGKISFSTSETVLVLTEKNPFKIFDNYEKYLKNFFLSILLQKKSY
jgi:hypothetical protein